MSARSDRVAVAIPAHDEAALIGRCLDALAVQQDAGDYVVVVLANGCSDATAAIARQPRALAVEVIETAPPPSEQTAGHARRAALAAAADLGGLVLTSDADCVADPDWIAAHRRAFAAGADAVAGRVSADWEELRHQPEAALAIGSLEWDYLKLIAQAEAIFDPRPHDPWPRHAQCCGANLAITAAMLARVGGGPRVASGEDRALIAAVVAADGRVRYDRGPHVVASARTVGRATGGMADVLASRLSPDYRCDDLLQPADTLVSVWRERAQARRAWRPGGAFATFGASWAARAPVPVALSAADLPAEIARLRDLIAAHG